MQTKSVMAGGAPILVLIRIIAILCGISLFFGKKAYIKSLLDILSLFFYILAQFIILLEIFVAAKKMVPPNKSCEKRIRQAQKANAANRSARSAIRTSLGIVRKAKTSEDALKEVPRLFSMLDKAAAKHRAGFNKNRASNYKSKVGSLLNKLSSTQAK